MEEKKNIADILYEIPIGTHLYSPIFGEVILTSVRPQDPLNGEDGYIEIETVTEFPSQYIFNVYGQYSSRGEVMLFPSRENHDWDNFKVMYFKPKDWVLMKNHGIKNHWILCQFSHEVDGMFVAVGGNVYDRCVVYDGNTDILGTSNDPH